MSDVECGDGEAQSSVQCQVNVLLLNEQTQHATSNAPAQVGAPGDGWRRRHRWLPQTVLRQRPRPKNTVSRAQNGTACAGAVRYRPPNTIHQAGVIYHPYYMYRPVDLGLGSIRELDPEKLAADGASALPSFLAPRLYTALLAGGRVCTWSADPVSTKKRDVS